MRARHPFLDHDGPIAFAHRGGNVAAPENTMAAFDHAVSLGYTHVETDVHVTSDGVLVAFHDNDLKRTCGVDGRIEDVSWSRLGAVKVGGTEPVPRLVDLITTYPTLRVNIDCKTEAAEAPLLDFLGTAGCFDRVCLGSFSDARLDRFRSAFGDRLCTSAGPREVARLVLGQFIPGAASHVGALAAQVPLRQGPLPVTTTRFVKSCHTRNIPVHVWTVNDEDSMRNVLQMGVDGIMSDDTVLLKKVLSGQGVW